MSMMTEGFEFSVDELAQRTGRKWSRYESDVIPMWIADTDYHVAPEIRAALGRAVVEEDLHYSDDQPLLELLANKVQRVNGLPISATGIYLTQGVLPALWLACRYACQPGDEVIVTDPMYYPFFRTIDAVQARTVWWPLTFEDGYRFEIEDVKAAISPKTNLIFLCNPHNPTGRVMTRDELCAIADLALDHDLIVASDELWEDVVYEGHTHISLASLGPEIAERTISIFGFSKAYNISGLQIGYIAATNDKIMQKLKAMARCILRGTSTLSKRVAKTILSGTVEYYRRAEMQYLHTARAYAFKRLEAIPGIRCNPLEGTYLLFPHVGAFGKTSTELVDYLLQEARVGVSDGSLFGPSGEGHIRINIGTSIPILREAFNRMERAL